GTECDDTMLPPQVGITGSPCTGVGAFTQATLEAQECPFLPSMVYSNACNPLKYVSAYHLNPNSAYTGPTSIGGCPAGSAGPCAAGTAWWGQVGSSIGVTAGYANPADIEAACLYLLQAAFPITPSGSTCGQVASDSFMPSQPIPYHHLSFPPGQNITLYIRSEPTMKAYGQIIADSLNFLFGTPNDSGGPGAAVLYGTGGCTTSNTTVAINLVQAEACVLQSSRSTSWNLYTGDQLFSDGWSAGWSPDTLWSHYYSRFTENNCSL